MLQTNGINLARVEGLTLENWNAIIMRKYQYSE